MKFGRKRLIITSLVAGAMTLGAAACSGTEENGGEKDTTAPVITVQSVPTSCNVGDTVIIPAATATDNVDGDISSKVKVTVTQMKADGVTPNKEILYEKLGNVEQSFVASSNTMLVYSIVYTVKDTAGNKAESAWTLTAIADNETGTLEINANSSEDYNADSGISGTAGKNVVLPSATAIDNPSTTPVDISNLVVARLYEKKGETVSTTLFASWKDFKEAKNVRIPAGEYVLEYSVTDVAGNEFETKCQIPVSIAQPGKTNLAADHYNFAYDNDDSMNGKEGMSWVNEYSELCFGHTSAMPTIDQTVGVSEKVTKVFEQYVAVSFNADAPGTYGQLFYTFAARGSKNRTTMPDKETCTWPNYLFVRMGTGGKIESRVEKSSDKEMTVVKDYDGASLTDGQNHVIYLQWKNVGESADAADAAIMIYGWIDKTPAVGYDNADFIFKAVAGDSIDTGKLDKTTFAELWNEDTGAGWFSMDTYSSRTPYGDDHMRIKGLVIYDANETDFDVDIIPPTVSVAFTPESVYAVSEAISIPTASVEGADGVKTYVIDPDGNKTEVTNGSYTPAKAGTYKLLYEATDEAGNYGYKAYSLNVQIRDEEAPELTISSTETITAKIGEEVTLPTATATDNLEGDISGKVTVEIVGTEHSTDRTPGGKYYPMTAGTQKVIYSVSDSFGNTTKKEFNIVVTGGTTGNILGSTTIGTSGGGKGLTSAEYIYDQKVSMILNISELSSVIMFNVRGPVGVQDWPTGMVIRFVNDNTITVSASGHDSYIFGTTSYSKQKYIVGTDILFEYQVKNVKIDDVEYIRVQIWIQGEELQFKANATNGGMVGLEEGVNAIYRKLSDFTGALAENIYSSPFWISAYNSSMEVKELRIDGTSCTKPADPVVPEGYEVTFNTGNNAFITSTTVVQGGGDTSSVIGKYSNENYIAVTFNGEEATKGAFCLNITGVANGWNGGLVIRISQDDASLWAGGVNATKLATLNVKPYSSGITATSYTLVYKMTYVKEKGLSTKLTIDIWFGEAGGTLQKCTYTVEQAELCTYTDGVLTILSKAFSSAENMTPLDITVVSLSALNGDCDWTITKAEKLDAAPGEAANGYESPLTSNAAEVKITSETTYAATTDSVVKAVENLNENYVQITMKHTANPTYYAMGINLLGTTSNGWSAGLVLAMTSDGHYFRIGGINASNLVQLNFYSMGNGSEITVAYKLTYIMSGNVCTKVKVELWQGSGDTLTKIAPHGGTTSGEKWSYNTDEKAFYFDYDIVTADNFAPDCTLIAMQAFNDRDVDCNWTVTKVSVSSTKPENLE